MSRSHLIAALIAVAAAPAGAQTVSDDDPVAVAKAMIAEADKFEPAPTTAASTDIMNETRSVGTRGFGRPASAVINHYARQIGVHFEKSSATLTASARGYLDKFTQEWMTKTLRTPMTLSVAGHTSASGAWATNMALSKARAEAVAAYIRDRLGDHVFTRIEARGYGFQQPLPGVKPDSPLNRRVVLALDSAGS